MVRIGATEVFVQAVGQMGGLLAGRPGGGPPGRA
jgi:hypothetical protein